MENYFFVKKGYERKRGFDSYSRDADDILDFYYAKYPEVAGMYKSPAPLTPEELNGMEPDTAFERYIAAFLLAMAGKYEEAAEKFYQCMELLDNSFSCHVNRIFIMLQLAQLYERRGNVTAALSTLRKVYREFRQNDALLADINNFYASCCVSIGLIYYKSYQNEHIANGLFAQSIDLRLKYKGNYPPQICENYLATAYRYKAVTYPGRHSDKYVDFKTAYTLRTWLLDNTQDEFTKVEFSCLAVDFLHFLINEGYERKYIDKVANRLYKVIFSMRPVSRQENMTVLVQAAQTLSRYYFLGEHYLRFYRWYALTKQFKQVFQADFEASFLNSEEIFDLLKS